VRAAVDCSPLELIQDSAKSLRRLLPEDIAIELDLDAAAPRVLIDPAQISHVLLNLGVNARDAMPAGGVLSLGVAPIGAAGVPAGMTVTSPSGRFLHISVRDTGVGMSAETRAHVFEPFFTTKGDRGTGLGLATAYAIVRQNSGFIQIESEEGKGTEVHIYFPEHLAAASEAAAAPPVPRRAKGALVMVTEDDPSVRSTMVRVLAAAGYRVLESADAASAMTELERVGADVDVLCTDGIMPGGGTRQLIDRYRARRPHGPVIVCSGYVQEELLRRDIDAGALEYLPKPFAPSELVRRIDALLSPAQEQRPERR
jgi:CheY-like chemotaxis protein